MRKSLCLLALLGFVAACHGPGQTAGDDPTRNNESPGEGRPMNGDPAARKPDQPASSEQPSGTLDGSSDETMTPSK
jgi:hypothetical protein